MRRQKTWEIAFLEDSRLATKPEDLKLEVLTQKIRLLNVESLMTASRSPLPSPECY